jgi:hypothetical protein
VSAPTHPSSKQLDPVSCETQGHLWGDSACIMCKTPKPKYAPSLEFAMRQVERCRNYAPTDRVENEDTIVTLGDEIERLQEDLRLARIESAHFANTQRATQAELEMARVSSSELERYKRALYQANGQLMQLDKEPVKLDYSADEPKNALDDKSLCDALTEALRHAFVPGMQTADGSPFQFVDLMSDPGTDISTGIDRIESFAENVTDEVMELLPQDSIVTDIKLRSIDEAERIYRAVQPPSAVPIRPYGEEVAPAGPWRVVRYGSPPDKGDMIFDERGCIAHFGEHHHEAVSRIVYEHNVSVMTHDKA